MNLFRRKKYGLNLIEPDERDFSLGGLGLKPPAPLHDNDFRIYEPAVEHQKSSDFCVSFATTTHKEKQEGKQLSPAGLQNIIKNRIDGNQAWGTSLQSAMKALVKYGCPTEADFPFKWNKGRNWLLDASHTNSLINKAAPYKSETYFKVDMNPNTFINYRSAMITYNECIVSGLKWNTAYDKIGSDGILPEPTGRATYGHAILIVGQKNINGKLYLDCLNSYGESFGDKGHFYVNKDLAARILYYGFISLDIERPLAEILEKYNGRAVKSDKTVDVFLIQDGKRRLFKNEWYCWAFGIKLWEDIIEIPKSELEKIPKGDPIKIDEGKFWRIMMEIAKKMKVNWDVDWL